VWKAKIRHSRMHWRLWFLCKNICLVILIGQRVYILAVCCKIEEVTNSKVLYTPLGLANKREWNGGHVTRQGK
jgi:hypothetical protein